MSCVKPCWWGTKQGFYRKHCLRSSGNLAVSSYVILVVFCISMTTVVCDWVYVSTIEPHCVRMCNQVCLIRNDVFTGQWRAISLQSSCWFCNVQTSNTYTSVGVLYYIQFLNVLHNRTQCRSPIRIWYATWGLVRTSLPVCLPLFKVVIVSYLYRIPAFHNYIHDWKPSIRNYYEIRYIVHYYVHKCIYYRNSVWSIRQVAMLRSVVVMIIVNFTTWRPLKLYRNLYFKSMSVGRYSVTPL